MIPYYYYIVFGLFLWGLLYKCYHIRMDAVATAPPPELPLGSLNGFGSTMLGAFRTPHADYRVYYVVLTILFLPIVPFGCVLASREGTKAGSWLPGLTTSYRIYGATRWNVWDVLSLYAVRWGLILSICFAINIYSGIRIDREFEQEAEQAVEQVAEPEIEPESAEVF